jgi:DNA mismatch repair protein MutS2
MKEYLHSFSKLEFDKVKKHFQRYASTDIGREHIERLSPSTSLEDIQKNLSFVSEMKHLLEITDAPPLEILPDIRFSLHRTSIENYSLPASELRKIAQVLETTQNIASFFTRRKTEFPLLLSLSSQLQVNSILQFNINRAIDENGEVKDSATKELGQIRRQIVEKSDHLRNRLETILKAVAEKDYIQEEIITTRDSRMVIPVKIEYKNRVPGFIHSTSASGATVFVEPTETLELNNDIRTLQFKEQREIERILRDLTEQVGEVKDTLLVNILLLGDIDFILAKAKYSIEIIGVEPIITTDGGIRLIDARHPLLLLHHKRDETIPLNLHIGPETRTIVISGPNAGGKSVALKTIGLLSILAQSGCHIPAVSGSELPIFTELFVDIGDEQSIEDDLSSFSSHLKNLKELVENVTVNSLVLIDELGSGTDPVEGASLAAAILESLTNLGCTTVATTHHGSLKTFAFETPGVENAAMEFDQATLRPTYKFKLGLPGSSYAMEMAERIDFPELVVKKAKELRGSSAYNFDKLINDLQRQSNELTEELNHVKREKVRLDELTRSYKDKISSLQKDMKEIRQKAVLEAETIVERANSAIESTIKEIKEHAAEKEIVRSVRQEIKKLVTEVDHLKKDFHTEEAAEPDFVPGNTVRLKHSNSLGEILQKVDSSHYLVLVGNLKVKIAQKELQLSNEQPQKHLKSAAHLSQGEVKREVDLRGMYGDEAIEAIEKLFDEAILSGLNRVDIIHGKGTGALRKRVTAFLKNNPAVKSYRLGEWNEGGTGVTVVELA